MESPLELLNRVLSNSQPHQTIRLPLHQANLIATLNERELGRELLAAISQIGVAAAMEKEGLFSRHIIISSTDESFVVMDDPIANDDQG